MKYRVERLDNNPTNHATYRTWVNVSTFETEDGARSYVDRASSLSQVLRVVPETYPRGERA